LRVLEFEGIGPGPFCGMMLADMGADVLLVDRQQDARLGFGRIRAIDVMFRGRRSVTLDLKSPDGVTAALAMADKADIVLEGNRPGVMERLGLGPDVMLARNPKLVYGRMTGWGQDGPLSSRAGHDINYIALSGALHAIGRPEQPPVPPLNLVGDFGGGGMLLAFGVVCAVLEARTSGHGQVVDAAMVEGSALLSTMFAGMRASGQWVDARGSNFLDSGAPWYGCYETKDGKYVSIGPVEPKFYEQLLARMGVDATGLPGQYDRASWPAMRSRFAEWFKAKTRDEWSALLADHDVCYAPVLSFDEAPLHPHAVARDGYVDVAGIRHPAPAPRFSRTPGEIRSAPPERGFDGRAALADWGFSADEIEQLKSLGAGMSA
jgi:alpha-methylacyl-CoA racemase